MNETETENHEKRITALATWLTESQSMGCTRVVIRVLRGRGDSVRVGEKVGEYRLAAVDPHRVAEEMYRTIDGEVRHLGARLSYCAWVYRGGESTGRFLLSTGDGEGDEEDLLLVAAATTSANAPAPGWDAVAQMTTQLVGNNAALMRHNEAAIRLSVGNTLDVINFYKELLGEREKRVRDLEERYWEVATLREKLASQQHARDLEMRKAEAQEKGIKAVGDTLFHQIIPGIMMSLGRGTAAPMTPGMAKPGAGAPPPPPSGGPPPAASGAAAPTPTPPSGAPSGSAPMPTPPPSGAAGTAPSAAPSAVQMDPQAQKLLELVCSLKPDQVMRFYPYLTPEQQQLVDSLAEPAGAGPANDAT